MAKHSKKYDRSAEYRSATALRNTGRCPHCGVVVALPCLECEMRTRVARRRLVNRVRQELVQEA